MLGLASLRGARFGVPGLRAAVFGFRGAAFGRRAAVFGFRGVVGRRAAVFGFGGGRLDACASFAVRGRVAAPDEDEPALRERREAAPRRPAGVEARELTAPLQKKV